MVILKSYPDEASSSTTHPLGLSYDVFLSFHGEDTRKNFTDHLYTALVRAGLGVFRDDDSIERGESLSPQLELAIKRSAISVIVFSKNYAFSRWCLEEVLTILEHRRSSKHHVIPIFYKVEPSDVRGQKGSYAEAFYKHQDKAESDTHKKRKRQYMEKVKAWRAALKEVADLTGFVLSHEYESRFIDKVVHEVEKKLDRKALQVAQHLVGVGHTVSSIISWIQDKSNNASILVIHGIGGIGKTTISKLVFNSCRNDFEGNCFLSTIRERSKSPNGILVLQSQILSTILKRQHEEKIWNIDEGTMKIQYVIQGKRVLIVLDDVTSMDQVDVLLGPQRFYPGSKIIITTRHKGLLNDLKYCEDMVLSREIKKIDFDRSMKLFSWYAFGQDQPLEAYLKQSNVIVYYCDGLPLALKVIGSSLRNKDINLWEATIRKLEEMSNPEIHKMLQISYDSLEDDTDQRLFLHLACFFNEYDIDFIVTILDHCGFHPLVGIQNLHDRCLLVIEDNKVVMHQLIQEMGREIVRQESPENPGERSRLWEHKDSFNVLNENMGSNRIEGLILDIEKLEKEVIIEPTNNTNHQEIRWHETFPSISHVSNRITSFKCGNELDLKTDSFEKMNNLMLLQLYNVRLSGQYSNLPKRLRWLRWYGFPLNSMHSEIPSKKLVVLDMCYSKLVLVSNGFKSMPSLKILNLSYSKELVRTPDFGGLPSLKSLILKGCVSLIDVCESVKDLKELVLMDLEDCTSLTNIPYLPCSLQTLKISNCFLQSLGFLGRSNIGPSDSLPNFLVKLCVRGCNLSEHCFPTDMSHLVSLVKLDLSENLITILPPCIRSLPSLEVLDVSDCSQLQYIAGLPNTIRKLYIRWNDLLQQVLLDLSSKLEVFDAEGSRNLTVANGLFKFTFIDNVDEKIINFLGLESIHLRVADVISTANLCIRVLYEFGIFSTVAYHMKELPGCFTFRAKSKHLAFKVPSLPSDRKICGFKLCFLSSYNRHVHTRVSVEIHNTTRGINWKYSPSSLFLSKDFMCSFVWLSVWKCGDFLKVGDKVQIELTYVTCPRGINIVHECGVNLIYEEDLMLETEETNARKEENRGIEEWGAPEIGTSPRLSWTDKLFVEISNYCNSGKRYMFLSGVVCDYQDKDNESRQYVNWWGPVSGVRELFDGRVHFLDIDAKGPYDEIYARIKENILEWNESERERRFQELSRTPVTWTNFMPWIIEISGVITLAFLTWTKFVPWILVHMGRIIEISTVISLAILTWPMFVSWIIEISTVIILAIRSERRN